MSSQNTNRPVVLITGCSSGIGKATALRLADSARVFASARRPESLVELADAGCDVVALDVTDEGSMQSAVEGVTDIAGRIDVLVNNAGYSQSGAVEDLPIESIRRQFETNVFGVIRLSQLVLPDMRARRSGKIINIGSMGGKLTFPGGGIYHATKYAIEAISDAMRFELAGFGVHVALVEPGLIRSSFAEAVSAGMHESRTDGAYDEFNATVERRTKDVYENPIYAKAGGGADSVAQVIEKIIASDKPKSRYKVTLSAHALIAQRALMTDGMWDAYMRTQFPSPGKQKKK